VPERLLQFIFLWLLAVPAWALELGEELPLLRIDDLGELRLEGEGRSFSPWDSAGMRDQVQVLQYLAARISVRDLNKPFTDRLRDSGISLDRYHVTTIVNLDDALFGTRGFALNELEKTKRRYYRSTVVADSRGEGLLAWELAPRTSAIIILDTTGRIRFLHEGAMSARQIDDALALVRAGADGLALH